MVVKKTTKTKNKSVKKLQVKKSNTKKITAKKTKATKVTKKQVTKKIANNNLVDELEDQVRRKVAKSKTESEKIILKSRSVWQSLSDIQL